ncbi:MAG: Uma2 family endonuclease [Ktedonobacterales bacterium]
MAAPESSDTEPKWEIPADLRRELLTVLLRAPSEKPKMSYEEFLDWLDEDTLAEWVNGEVVMTSPASLRHQLIATLLLRTLSTFAEMRDLGVVVPPPFQMKLATSGREPDAIFVAAAHRDRLKPTYLVVSALICTANAA